MYLPSYGATANVVHHKFDLYFEGHNIWNMNILKMVRASKNFSSITLIEVDICHWMGPLWLVYSGTLIFIVKVKHFLVMNFFYSFYFCSLFCIDANKSISCIPLMGMWDLVHECLLQVIDANKSISCIPLMGMWDLVHEWLLQVITRRQVQLASHINVFVKQIQHQKLQI